MLVRPTTVEVMEYVTLASLFCVQHAGTSKDCPKRVSASGYQPPQRDNFRGAGPYPHQFGSRGNRGGAQVKLCAANDPVRTVVLRDCGVQCGEEGHCVPRTVVSPKLRGNLGNFP